jgi:hypothetical protein
MPLPIPLNCSDCYGTLTVNSIDLNLPSWCFDLLLGLLHESDVRGGDRLVGHTVGTLPRRRRRTVTRRDIGGIVTGHYTQAGFVNADPYQGLLDNIAALKAGLGIAEDAPAGITGTVAAQWNQPDASVKNAVVHVLGLRYDLPPAAAKNAVAPAVLSLSFPFGNFA